MSCPPGVLPTAHGGAPCKRHPHCDIWHGRSDSATLYASCNFSVTLIEDTRCSSLLGHDAPPLRMEVATCISIALFLFDLSSRLGVF